MLYVDVNLIAFVEILKISAKFFGIFTNKMPTYTGEDAFKLLSDEFVNDFTFDTRYDLKIYPNPVSDNLTIMNFKTSAVTITDLLGRNILNSKVKSACN